MTFSKLIASAALVAAAYPLTALAAETPIGKPHTENGMEVAAVYLQPIEMEPSGMMREAKLSDIHLEADIRAAKGNTNGFGEGDWMPSLVVKYKLTKAGNAKPLEGVLMPMVASDGPHYGNNIKMMGVGNYTVTYHIEPPPKAGMHRHTDKETGVARWWKPFDVKFDFKYTGLN